MTSYGATSKCLKLAHIYVHIEMKKLDQSREIRPDPNLILSDPTRFF
jgi:hypothetical protein